MSQPSYYSEGVTPLPTDTRLKIWTKILGRFQNAPGALAKNNPKRNNSLWDILFKLARATGDNPPRQIARVPLERRIYDRIVATGGGSSVTNVFTYNGSPKHHLAATGTAVCLVLVDQFVRLYIKFTLGTSKDEWIYEFNLGPQCLSCPECPSPPAPTIVGTYREDTGELTAISVTSAIPGLNPEGAFRLYGDFSGLLDERPNDTANPVFTNTSAWSVETNVWVIEVGNGGRSDFMDYCGDSPASNVIETIDPQVPVPTIEGTYGSPLSSVTVTSNAGTNVGGTFVLTGDNSGVIATVNNDAAPPQFSTASVWASEDSLTVVETANGVDYNINSNPSESIDTSSGGTQVPAPTIEGTYGSPLSAVSITSAVPGGNVGGTFVLIGNSSGVLATGPNTQAPPQYSDPSLFVNDSQVWAVETANGSTYNIDSDPSNSIDTSGGGGPQVSWTPDTAVASWTDTNGPQTGNLAVFNATADYASVTDLDLSGTSLTDISGLGGLTNLNNLNISSNSFVGLDLTSLTFIGTTLDIHGCTLCTSVNLSNLTSFTQLKINGCTALTSFSLASGISAGAIVGNGCSVLTSITLAGITLSGLNFSSCPLLSSVDISGSTLQDATMTFNGDALSQSSVDSILSIGVSSGLTSATINLAGGTSFPPTNPLGDKQTLIDNGCSVTTN